MEQAEIDALVKPFTELGVKPKADSAASLVGWMVDYVSSQGLEQKPVLREDTKPARTLPPQDKLLPKGIILEGKGSHHLGIEMELMPWHVKFCNLFLLLTCWVDYLVLNRSHHALG